MMDRRTFIKGAVIAASTPAAAFAPALVTTLDALISEHAAVTDQAGELAERIDTLSSDRSRPALAFVTVAEIDPENSVARLTGDKRKFVAGTAIDAYFADLKQGVEHSRAQGFCSHLFFERRLEQIPCQIIAAKALLREREAAMEAWETACGITTLQA